MARSKTSPCSAAVPARSLSSVQPRASLGSSSPANTGSAHGTLASTFDLGDRRVDLGAGEDPIIVEICHHLAHERIAEADRARRVPQMLDQNDERQLLRAVPLIAPLKAPRRKAFGRIALIEPAAVDGHDQTVDRAFAFERAHVFLASRPTRPDISPVAATAKAPAHRDALCLDDRQLLFAVAASGLKNSRR